MLWHCIFRARQHRISLGYGQLRTQWINAHIAADVAVSQGVCPAKWLANAIADTMAGRAAELVQLTAADHSKIRENSALSNLVLRRLVAVAIQVAPPRVSTTRVIKVAGRGEDQSPLIDFWAKKSGHSLDKHYECVKCKLKIDVSRNLAYSASKRALSFTDTQYLHVCSL